VCTTSCRSTGIVGAGVVVVTADGRILTSDGGETDVLSAFVIVIASNSGIHAA